MLRISFGVHLSGVRLHFAAVFVDQDTICSRFFGLRHYSWLILWNEILLIADFMDLNYLQLILRTKILLVAYFCLNVAFLGVNSSPRLIIRSVLGLLCNDYATSRFRKGCLINIFSSAQDPDPLALQDFGFLILRAKYQPKDRSLKFPDH